MVEAAQSTPFWPRKSPHFRRCRTAVRAVLATLPPSRPLYIGLSGGADSLALCAAVVAETRQADTHQAPARQPASRQVMALCVDHQLQAESQAVAQQAAAQAEAFGVPALVVKAEVSADDIASYGLEAAARQARYVALAQQIRLLHPARENLHSQPALFIAHTANDQAETLVLGALRGYGTGMAPVTDIEGIQVYRPLLELSRADTLGACTELGLSPWQDPHNDNTDFRRVGVRTETLPHLAQLHGGDVIPPLAQAAADIAADHAFFEQLIDSSYTHAFISLNSKSAGPVAGMELVGQTMLDCAVLADAPEPVRRRLILRWLHEHQVGLTREVVGRIDKLCSNWHGQGGVAVGQTPAFRQLYGKNDAGRLEVLRVGGKLALLRKAVP